MKAGFCSRDYQRDFVRSCLQAWGELEGGPEEKYSKIVGVLPTGLGKTVCAAMLFDGIVASGGRPLFLGDTDELCSQPIATIHRTTGRIPALEKGQDRAPMSSDCVVGSVQTLDRKNRLERYPKDFFTHIIADEAHRGVQRHLRIFEHFESAKKLGLTATAFRQNMQDLSAYYDYVAFKMEMFDSVDLGYMPPIMVQTLPITVDLSEVRQSMTAEGKDYRVDELDSTIRPYYEAIVDALLEKARGRYIAAFLPLVQSSKDFVSVCQSKGLAARHVDGNCTDRQEILESFNRKQFQLISSSSLLTTGWDCAHVDCILNLRPTRSVGLFRQIVGRGTRVLPGVIDGVEDPAARKKLIAASAKPNLLVFDLLWQTAKFGLAGPASLIAENDQDAEEIERRARKAKDPEELQAIHMAFQKEKEDKLIAQLEQAAKKQARFMDAKQACAVMGFLDLIDYEPVFKYEHRLPSEKQWQVIDRAGIDRLTVKTFGHASKLIDAIFKRRNAGLTSLQTIRALKAKDVEDPEAWTESDAAMFLGEDRPFPFGKFRGTPMSQVSDSYYRWLERQPWLSSWPDVEKYVHEKFNVSGESRKLAQGQDRPVTV